MIAEARPGSGKTTSLISRLQHVTRTHGGSGTFLSFNRSVVDEINLKRLPALGIPRDVLGAKTIHQICLALVKQNRGMLGFKDLTIINERECAVLYGDYMGSTDNRDDAQLSLVAKLDAAMPAKFSAFHIEKKLARYEIQKSPSDIQMLVNVIREYRTKRRKEGLFLIGEILMLATRLPAQCWKPFQIDHLGLDEAQDITPEHLQVLEPLIKMAKTCSIVYDPYQEINAWNGSDSNGLLTKLKTWFPSLETYYIQNNYRSTPKVIDFCNVMLSKQGATALMQATRPDNDRSKIKRLTLPEFQTMCNTADPEYFADSALLYRGFAQLDNEIIPFLNEYTNLDYRLKDSTSIGDLELVFDYYRLILQESPSRAAWNNVLEHHSYLGRRTANNIWEHTRGKPLQINFVPNERWLTPIFHTFCTQLACLSQIVRGSATPAEGLNYLARFIAASTSYDPFSDPLFIDVLQNANAMKGPYDILYFRERSYAKQAAKRDKLIVSTVHKAKGLEYDKVFVWIPGLTGMDPKEAEEGRIEYVAASRAKNKLFLIGAENSSLIINSYAKYHSKRTFSEAN